MNKTSLLSGIALATAVLGFGIVSPVTAARLEQRSGLLSEHSEIMPTDSAQLIAATRCVNRRVYHQGYYTRGLFGRRVYHKGYYSTNRVCYRV